MSRFAHTDNPGQVIIRPARPGRRANFGALCSVEEKMMVCVGYTPDGKSVAYVPMVQLSSLKGAYKRGNSKVIYRLLKRLIQHYEVAA